MTQELEKLLEKARGTSMTQAEKDTQRLSFAYGNSHFEDQTITRETVRRESEKLKTSDGSPAQ